MAAAYEFDRDAPVAFCSEAVVELLAMALERTGRIVVGVRGSSMRPLIRSGAQVAFIRTDDVAIGDVVLARVEGGVRCHRVVARADGGWVLRGDALTTADGVVRSDEILGRAEGITVRRRSSTQVPRPVARWVRAHLLVPGLPVLRTVRQATRRFVGQAAARVIVGPVLVRLVAGRIHVERLAPTTGGALASQLMAWGVCPTRDALAAWHRRANGQDAFALVAHAGVHTRGLIAVDEAAHADGARTGTVSDARLMGPLFAADTARYLVGALVPTARVRGLRELRALPDIATPLRVALLGAGFKPLKAGPLTLAL